MKTIIIALAILIITSCSSQVPKSSIHGKIIEYGLYEGLGEYRTRKDCTTPSKRCGYNTGGRLLVKQTENIPLLFGIRFGYKFEIHGFSGSEATLRIVVNHPPIGRPGENVKRSYEKYVTFDVNNGVVSGKGGYYLNHDYEVVPGTWTWTFYHNDEQLLSKSFYVSEEFIEPNN